MKVLTMFKRRERGTEHTAELASGAGAGKELRLFGLGGWLDSRRAGSHEELMARNGAYAVLYTLQANAYTS